MSLALIEKCCLLTDEAAGDPTHFMIDRAFEQLGLDWRFLTFEVQPSRLAEVLTGVDALGFRGVLLAPSLGAAAASVLAEQTTAAQRAGAINSLFRLGDVLTGDNTRVGALRQAAGGFAERRVAIVGAGRESLTLASAVLGEQPAKLLLTSFDIAALEPLAAACVDMASAEMIELRPLPDWPLPGRDEIDVLIVESEADAKGLDIRQFPAELTVVDTALGASRTTLIRTAAAQGMPIIDGITLLAGEVSLAVERWTGQSLDRAHLRDSVEEFLGI
jgi:shikimate dehydrogenase